MWYNIYIRILTRDIAYMRKEDHYESDAFVPEVSRKCQHTFKNKKLDKKFDSESNQILKSSCNFRSEDLWNLFLCTLSIFLLRLPDSWTQSSSAVIIRDGRSVSWNFWATLFRVNLNWHFHSKKTSHSIIRCDVVLFYFRSNFFLTVF